VHVVSNTRMGEMPEVVEENKVCWICLDADAESLGSKPVAPCGCPTVVHKKCLANWQLVQAGRDEEKKCRFCEQLLPDWRPVLTPAHLNPASPIVSIHYGGRCYRLRVKPGTSGYMQFRSQLQNITGTAPMDTMQITFQCKSPDTGMSI
jgi:hypothetical protein